ncbi:hypothetical protein SAMN05443544_0551 [Agromyces cerinus subsp. cerinus]|uniref:Uncharacterized protein n=1 Tax=Agromyces cerinus subsp. cerinus TaxID=232089 RepID=A0A1N6DP69_9MICO|nr:hypothetical protein SAMN05443544_0551 [Agromyces cerinus subsp. cerinus]
MSKNRRRIDWEEFWFGATLFVMALSLLVAPWVVAIVRGH